MARPRLPGPEVVPCAKCGAEVEMRKHSRARWRKGQRTFYCANECYAATRVGVRRPDVSERMKGNTYATGLTPPNAHRLDRPDYFESIDTEEKAYWAGYVMADGCLHSAAACGPRFSMGSVDVEHLQRFAEAIGFYGRLHERVTGHWRPFVFVDLGNRQLCESLFRLGVLPRKSYWLPFPEWVEDWQLPHFFRGYLDADGHVSLSKSGRPYLTVAVVGRQEFLEPLAARVASMAGLRSCGIHRHSGELYSLRRSQEQAARIGDFMYRDASVYMDRKRAKYESFIGKR